jgi:hypothetical protein
MDTRGANSVLATRKVCRGPRKTQCVRPGVQIHRAFRHPLPPPDPALVMRKTEDRLAGKSEDCSSNGGGRNTVPIGCGCALLAKVLSFSQLKYWTAVHYVIESLDELSDMVTKFFSDIPNRGEVEALPAIPDHPFGQNEKGVS